jgi:isopenicillin N synthase-like dioxygenase
MLPVVDLSASYDAAAREIRAAVCDTGFFYVRNHGVDQQLVDAAFAQARRFLTLPRPVKERVQRGPGRRGYEALEGQATGVYLRGPDEPVVGDFKESFNFGRDRGPRSPSFALDQWPADLPGFREPLESYYTALDALGQRLIRLMSSSLGLGPDGFAEAYRFPAASCRLLRYPPQRGSGKEHQLGAAPHTDVGGITLLAQDEHDALELCDVHGRWIGAVPLPGTFVVNVADMFARWTNDLYRSSIHRVVNGGDADRYSIVFFFNPNYFTRVEPLPSCVSAANPARYEPVVYGEYGAARLAGGRAHAQAVR